MIPRSKKRPAQKNAAANAEANAAPIPEDETVRVEAIRARMSESDDLIYTDVQIAPDAGVSATLVFLDGMISTQTVYDYILKPLAQEAAFTDAASADEVVAQILRGRVYHGQRKLCATLTETIEELLFGSALLVFERCAIAFDSKGFDKRGITEPTNESVLKGSKESFVEVLRVNTALIRRRVQTSALKISQLKLGRRTNTAVALVYIDGIVNPATVAAVRARLTAADIDGLVSVGQLEELLNEKNYSPFPQILYTERPDKFAGNLLEGRVGIIIDGMPLGYITPIDFNSLLQAPEDYATHYVLSTMYRILRYMCSFAALVIPAFYVSVTSFHQEMIPTKLAISIIASKQGVPFPTYMEVLLMLLAFEVLMEAGLRLPRVVGQTVSIVGALAVGQAAITAHILSPGVVIVIAAAGIAGFVVPSQDLSGTIRIFRILLVLAATVGGLFLTSIGLTLILYHMCTIEVFGTPYLSPYAGGSGRQMFDDAIVRRSWRGKWERPENISPVDPIRQGGRRDEKK